MLTKEELQNRLSTLLKASEGMEKALEEIEMTPVGGETFWAYVGKLKSIAKQAIADFMVVRGDK